MEPSARSHTPAPNLRTDGSVYLCPFWTVFAQQLVYTSPTMLCGSSSSPKRGLHRENPQPALPLQSCGDAILGVGPLHGVYCPS